jgi:UDP-glucose 4-epimerase
MQAEAFHLQTGIDTVSARLFNAYGTRETNPHLIPEIIEQIKQGNTQIELGNITTKRSYVCVKDIAKALLGLLESDKVSKHEVCNIGSHHEYNAEELVNMLSEITGHPIECMSVKERQRASDRPRLQPALEKLENLTDWHEEYDMKIGLSEIVSEEL